MTSRRPLRIAVLGNLDSIHTQRWLRAFADRGHDMHAVSFYRPHSELPGVTVHSLQVGSGIASEGSSPAGRSLTSLIGPSLLRPVHLVRYRNAGLRQAIATIKPDVLHAHYLVEYGFYATAARFHPLVVSAWGSDVYQAPHSSVTHAVARLTLKVADRVTASDPAMLHAMRKMGARAHRSDVVRIGALEELFFDEKPRSVNLTPGTGPLTILSTRSLEPLYNIDILIRAFARARNHVPGVRLRVAHDGSQLANLKRLASDLKLEDSVEFLGRLTPEQIRQELARAHVYASVPLSDSMSASTMEAMARGCFPVVTDLPSQDGFIDHGVTGLRVPAGDINLLALELQRALVDAELRQKAVVLNRAKVDAEGRLSAQVDRLEASFYDLVGRGTHR